MERWAGDDGGGGACVRRGGQETPGGGAVSLRRVCHVCDPPSITRSNTLTHNYLCVRWLTFFDFLRGRTL